MKKLKFKYDTDERSVYLEDTEPTIQDVLLDKVCRVYQRAIRRLMDAQYRVDCCRRNVQREQMGARK